MTVEWRGRLAKGQTYVFMANHLSAVDIWALYVALPVRVRMIAKKQLAAVPLLGWGMRAGRFIFVDRVNAIAARRSIDEAARRIRGGDSVLIFPEERGRGMGGWGLQEGRVSPGHRFGCADGAGGAARDRGPACPGRACCCGRGTCA